jgi:hypothetical protein
VAQQLPPTIWEGPYDFKFLATSAHDCDPEQYTGFITGPYFGGEIAHGGLCAKGRPVSDLTDQRGKVLLIRSASLINGISLWSPALPGETENADPGEYPERRVRRVIFCSGHTFDGDGDFVIGAGDRGLINVCDYWCDPEEPNFSHVFDPSQANADNWWPLEKRQLPMLVKPSTPGYGHYYPTLVTLHDGTVVSAGGSTAPWITSCPQAPPPFVHADETQRFNKAANRWEGQFPGQPNDIPFPGLPDGANPIEFGIYPLLHLTSDRSLVCSVALDSEYVPNVGSVSHSAFADATTWPLGAWQVMSTTIQNATTPAATNLLFPTAISFPWIEGGPYQSVAGGDRFIVIGGADQNDPYVLTPVAVGRAAEKAVWELKKESPSGSWSTATWSRNSPWPAMTYPRIYANAVILPDMTMMVFGGSQNFFAPYSLPTGTPPEVLPQPVFFPERIDLLNPAAGWQTMTPHQSPRLYHSIALLLPDGRVLVAGGYVSPAPPSPLATGYNFTDAEIYRPPYLQENLPRPQIVSQLPPITYGQDFDVTVAIDGVSNPAQSIDSAVLIRCPSVTHHFNFDQKVVRLGVREVLSSNQVRFRGIPAKNETDPSLPHGDFIAPPGWYMLFIVSTPQGTNGNRIPSIAPFVKVQ